MEITQNTVVHDNGVAVVKLGGRLTAVSTPGVKAETGRLVAAGVVRIVYDLTEVTFLDSSGLAAFVSALKTTRSAGGTVKLCGVSEQVALVFELTRLNRVFDMYPDEAEAAGAF